MRRRQRRHGRPGAAAAADAAAATSVRRRQVRCGAARLACEGCEGRGWVVMERPVKAESAWDLAPSTLGWLERSHVGRAARSWPRLPVPAGSQPSARTRRVRLRASSPLHSSSLVLHLPIPTTSPLPPRPCRAPAPRCPRSCAPSPCATPPRPPPLARRAHGAPSRRRQRHPPRPTRSRPRRRSVSASARSRRSRRAAGLETLA
jgi:hypothetical protein